jgi:hypothetical protein
MDESQEIREALRQLLHLILRFKQVFWSIHIIIHRTFIKKHFYDLVCFSVILTIKDY